MTDITTKLRDGMADLVRQEAAREIDRLRAEIARLTAAKDAEITRLREALQCLVDAADTAPPLKVIAYISRAVEKARAALAQVAEVPE